MLRDINFGDVDAKNEILKQNRSGERVFFETFLIPERISVDDITSGRKYIILGLKGTGKTALLRYINDMCIGRGCISEIILFKSHISEEDRINLSKSSGFEVVHTGDSPVFIQDFKEAWKWMIYQRISALLKKDGNKSIESKKLYKITGVEEGSVSSSIGSLLSRIKSSHIKVTAEAAGIVGELGVDIAGSGDGRNVLISDVNRTCGELLNKIDLPKNIYLFFDELELFHQTSEQFDRDRRIIRDLVYATSFINAESSESGRKIFIVSSLRTEVLHSILELGHEIGRDVDDYGVRIDWSDGTDSSNHPLLRLIAKKISASSGVSEVDVWKTFFPDKISGQPYYKYILNSSYYRPRDIVRLLRVAREFRSEDLSFTSDHFEKTSIEYSKQTWLEVTEELLAIYSSIEISALQRFFLGFNTHFYKEDLLERIRIRYSQDPAIQELFSSHPLSKILSDLYRIGVVGNDFCVKKNKSGKPLQFRNRWIFRGNTEINDSERMAVHKSLWKHLSLVHGGG
ncbi:P-loop ATPase, Sll1717 family [Phaeospirillum tilakii]|uniref:P-loop ATPase, Sll1717 family n=1 Tax=Phaeospirillum tilakii TaxID=741673 RepID=A0ABW5CB79_9PROT